MFLPVFVCLSVCLLARLLKNACMDLDQSCVSTDVGTWTKWLTFEPDPDYSPDAGTGLLSPLSYKCCVTFSKDSPYLFTVSYCILPVLLFGLLLDDVFVVICGYRLWFFSSGRVPRSVVASERSKHLWSGCCPHHFHRKWIPAEPKDWHSLSGLNSSIWHCLAHWSSLQTE